MRKLSATLKTCLVLTALLSSPASWAWGPGHADVAAAVFERLPSELRNGFAPGVVQQAIGHDCHYPDSSEPFTVGQVGRPALDRLQAHGLKNRIGLHSDEGRAVAFGLLVDALREKQFTHAALWIAALSHSTADMAACNHDPLIHTATYGWAAWELMLPGGAPIKRLTELLDLHATAGDQPGGQAAFQQAIAALALHDDQRDAATALGAIMMYGQEGARFCGQRGAALMAGASGWVERQDAGARAQLWQNMAELGAWAVVRTVRDVEAALRLARDSGSIEPTPAVQALFQQQVLAWVRERKLEDDSLFAPLLRATPAAGVRAIGVVLEPTWRMNDALLGFSSRLLAASITRTLQQTGHPYVTLDVRGMLANGFPAPAEVPVVLIVASSLGNYQGLKSTDLDDRLAAYLAHGGRVLWIGGTTKPPVKALGVVAQAMRKGAAQALPVVDEEFVRGHVRLTIGGGDATWKVAHLPKTPAGWQQPLCPWLFDVAAGSNLEPLLKLEGSATACVVGVLTQDRKRAFLPVYAVTPHLLEGSECVASAAEPALDAAGCKMLFTALEYLK